VAFRRRKNFRDIVLHPLPRLRSKPFSLVWGYASLQAEGGVFLYNKSNRILSTKSLVLASLFVGINIILTRLGAIMLFNNTVRLSFGNIPLVLSGLVLGPIPGFLTGAVSDLLGFLINSHGGAYHPGFTISAGLTGAVPGIIMMFRERARLFEIVSSNIIIYLFVSGALNTLWLTQLMGTGFWVLLPARLVSNIPITVVNIIITFSVVKSLSKAGYI
jgi:ECF transporter S component (folate family)